MFLATRTESSDPNFRPSLRPRYRVFLWSFALVLLLPLVELVACGWEYLFWHYSTAWSDAWNMVVEKTGSPLVALALSWIATWIYDRWKEGRAGLAGARKFARDVRDAGVPILSVCILHFFLNVLILSPHKEIVTLREKSRRSSPVDRMLTDSQKLLIASTLKGDKSERIGVSAEVGDWRGNELAYQLLELFKGLGFGVDEAVGSWTSPRPAHPKGVALLVNDPQNPPAHLQRIKAALHGIYDPPVLPSAGMDPALVEIDISHSEKLIH